MRTSRETGSCNVVSIKFEKRMTGIAAGSVVINALDRTALQSNSRFPSRVAKICFKYAGVLKNVGQRDQLKAMGSLAFSLKLLSQGR